MKAPSCDSASMCHRYYPERYLKKAGLKTGLKTGLSDRTLSGEVCQNIMPDFTRTGRAEATYNCSLHDVACGTASRQRSLDSGSALPPADPAARHLFPSHPTNSMSDLFPICCTQYTYSGTSRPASNYREPKYMNRRRDSRPAMQQPCRNEALSLDWSRRRTR